MKVVIIDYNSGNVRSIENMLLSLGIKAELSANRDKILSADRIIFPGQGHFEQAMKNLEESGVVPVIKEALALGKPFLGICLGLQILFEKSEEAPNVRGLGLIEGEVKKFVEVKTPQIGWNKIETTLNNDFLSEDYFYFVNSYYVVPKNEAFVSSRASYGIDFCASIQKDNLVGVQFHPEKSSEAGIEFFKKWLSIN